MRFDDLVTLQKITISFNDAALFSKLYFNKTGNVRIT